LGYVYVTRFDLRLRLLTLHAVTFTVYGCWLRWLRWLRLVTCRWLLFGCYIVHIVTFVTFTVTLHVCLTFWLLFCDYCIWFVTFVTFTRVCYVGCWFITFTLHVGYVVAVWLFYSLHTRFPLRLRLILITFRYVTILLLLFGCYVAVVCCLRCCYVTRCICWTCLLLRLFPFPVWFDLLFIYVTVVVVVRLRLILFRTLILLVVVVCWFTICFPTFRLPRLRYPFTVVVYVCYVYLRFDWLLPDTVAPFWFVVRCWLRLRFTLPVYVVTLYVVDCCYVVTFVVTHCVCCYGWFYVVVVTRLRLLFARCLRYVWLLRWLRYSYVYVWFTHVVRLRVYVYVAVTFAFILRLVTLLFVYVGWFWLLLRFVGLCYTLRYTRCCPLRYDCLRYGYTLNVYVVTFTLFTLLFTDVTVTFGLRYVTLLDVRFGYGWLILLPLRWFVTFGYVVPRLRLRLITVYVYVVATRWFGYVWFTFFFVVGYTFTLICYVCYVCWFTICYVCYVVTLLLLLLIYRLLLLHLICCYVTLRLLPLDVDCCCLLLHFTFTLFTFTVGYVVVYVCYVCWLLRFTFVLRLLRFVTFDLLRVTHYVIYVTLRCRCYVVVALLRFYVVTLPRCWLIYVVTLLADLRCDLNVVLRYVVGCYVVVVLRCCSLLLLPFGYVVDLFLGWFPVVPHVVVLRLLLPFTLVGCWILRDFTFTFTFDLHGYPFHTFGCWLRYAFYVDFGCVTFTLRFRLLLRLRYVYAFTLIYVWLRLILRCWTLLRLRLILPFGCVLRLLRFGYVVARLHVYVWLHTLLRLRSTVLICYVVTAFTTFTVIRVDLVTFTRCYVGCWLICYTLIYTFDLRGLVGYVPGYHVWLPDFTVTFPFGWFYVCIPFTFDLLRLRSRLPLRLFTGCLRLRLRLRSLRLRLHVYHVYVTFPIVTFTVCWLVTVATGYVYTFWLIYRCSRLRLTLLHGCLRSRYTPRCVLHVYGYVDCLDLRFTFGWWLLRWFVGYVPGYVVPVVTLRWLVTHCYLRLRLFDLRSRLRLTLLFYRTYVVTVGWFTLRLCRIYVVVFYVTRCYTDVVWCYRYVTHVTLRCWLLHVYVHLHVWFTRTRLPRLHTHVYTRLLHTVYVTVVTRCTFGLRWTVTVGYVGWLRTVYTLHFFTAVWFTRRFTVRFTFYVYTGYVYTHALVTHTVWLHVYVYHVTLRLVGWLLRLIWFTFGWLRLDTVTFVDYVWLRYDLIYLFTHVYVTFTFVGGCYGCCYGCYVTFTLRVCLHVYVYVVCCYVCYVPTLLLRLRSFTFAVTVCYVYVCYVYVCYVWVLLHLRCWLLHVYVTFVTFLLFVTVTFDYYIYVARLLRIYVRCYVLICTFGLRTFGYVWLLRLFLRYVWFTFTVVTLICWFDYVWLRLRCCLRCCWLFPLRLVAVPTLLRLFPHDSWLRSVGLVTLRCYGCSRLRLHVYVWLRYVWFTLIYVFRYRLQTLHVPTLRLVYVTLLFVVVYTFYTTRCPLIVRLRSLRLRYYRYYVTYGCHVPVTFTFGWFYHTPYTFAVYRLVTFVCTLCRTRLRLVYVYVGYVYGWFTVTFWHLHGYGCVYTHTTFVGCYAFAHVPHIVTHVWFCYPTRYVYVPGYGLPGLFVALHTFTLCGWLHGLHVFARLRITPDVTFDLRTRLFCYSHTTRYGWFDSLRLICARLRSTFTLHTVTHFGLRLVTRVFGLRLRLRCTFVRCYGYCGWLRTHYVVTDVVTFTVTFVTFVCSFTFVTVYVLVYVRLHVTVAVGLVVVVRFVGSRLPRSVTVTGYYVWLRFTYVTVPGCHGYVWLVVERLRSTLHILPRLPFAVGCYLHICCWTFTRFRLPFHGWLRLRLVTTFTVTVTHGWLRCGCYVWFTRLHGLPVWLLPFYVRLPFCRTTFTRLPRTTGYGYTVTRLVGSFGLRLFTRLRYTHLRLHTVGCCRFGYARWLPRFTFTVGCCVVRYVYHHVTLPRCRWIYVYVYVYGCSGWFYILHTRLVTLRYVYTRLVLRCGYVYVYLRFTHVSFTVTVYVYGTHRHRTVTVTGYVRCLPFTLRFYVTFDLRVYVTTFVGRLRWLHTFGWFHGWLIPDVFYGYSLRLRLRLRLICLFTFARCYVWLPHTLPRLRLLLVCWLVTFVTLICWLLVHVLTFTFTLRLPHTHFVRWFTFTTVTFVSVTLVTCPTRYGCCYVCLRLRCVYVDFTFTVTFTDVDWPFTVERLRCYVVWNTLPFTVGLRSHVYVCLIYVALRWFVVYVVTFIYVHVTVTVTIYRFGFRLHGWLVTLFYHTHHTPVVTLPHVYARLGYVYTLIWLRSPRLFPRCCCLIWLRLICWFTIYIVYGYVCWLRCYTFTFTHVYVYVTGRCYGYVVGCGYGYVWFTLHLLRLRPALRLLRVTVVALLVTVDWTFAFTLFTLRLPVYTIWFTHIAVTVGYTFGYAFTFRYPLIWFVVGWFTPHHLPVTFTVCYVCPLYVHVTFTFAVDYTFTLRYDLTLVTVCLVTFRWLRYGLPLVTRVYGWFCLRYVDFGYILLLIYVTFVYFTLLRWFYALRSLRWLIYVYGYVVGYVPVYVVYVSHVGWFTLRLFTFTFTVYGYVDLRWRCCCWLPFVIYVFVCLDVVHVWFTFVVYDLILRFDVLLRLLVTLPTLYGYYVALRYVYIVTVTVTFVTLPRLVTFTFTFTFGHVYGYVVTLPVCLHLCYVCWFCTISLRTLVDFGSVVTLRFYTFTFTFTHFVTGWITRLRYVLLRLDVRLVTRLRYVTFRLRLCCVCYRLRNVLLRLHTHTILFGYVPVTRLRLRCWHHLGYVTVVHARYTFGYVTFGTFTFTLRLHLRTTYGLVTFSPTVGFYFHVGFTVYIYVYVCGYVYVYTRWLVWLRLHGCFPHVCSRYVVDLRSVPVWFTLVTLDLFGYVIRTPFPVTVGSPLRTTRLRFATVTVTVGRLRCFTVGWLRYGWVPDCRFYTLYTFYGYHVYVPRLVGRLVTRLRLVGYGYRCARFVRLHVYTAVVTVVTVTWLRLHVYRLPVHVYVRSTRTVTRDTFGSPLRSFGSLTRTTRLRFTGWIARLHVVGWLPVGSSYRLRLRVHTRFILHVAFTFTVFALRLHGYVLYVTVTPRCTCVYVTVTFPLRLFPFCCYVWLRLVVGWFYVYVYRCLITLLYTVTFAGYVWLRWHRFGWLVARYTGSHTLRSFTLRYFSPHCGLHTFTYRFTHTLDLPVAHRFTFTVTARTPHGYRIVHTLVIYATVTVWFYTHVYGLPSGWFHTRLHIWLGCVHGWFTVWFTVGLHTHGFYTLLHVVYVYVCVHTHVYVTVTFTFTHRTRLLLLDYGWLRWLLRWVVTGWFTFGPFTFTVLRLHVTRLVHVYTLRLRVVTVVGLPPHGFCVTHTVYTHVYTVTHILRLVTHGYTRFTFTLRYHTRFTFIDTFTRFPVVYVAFTVYVHVCWRLRLRSFGLRLRLHVWLHTGLHVYVSFTFTHVPHAGYVTRLHVVTLIDYRLICCYPVTRLRYVVTFALRLFVVTHVYVAFPYILHFTLLVALLLLHDFGVGVRYCCYRCWFVDLLIVDLRFRCWLPHVVICCCCCCYIVRCCYVVGLRYVVPVLLLRFVVVVDCYCCWFVVTLIVVVDSRCCSLLRFVTLVVVVVYVDLRWFVYTRFTLYVLLICLRYGLIPICSHVYVLYTRCCCDLRLLVTRYGWLLRYVYVYGCYCCCLRLLFSRCYVCYVDLRCYICWFTFTLLLFDWLTLRLLRLRLHHVPTFTLYVCFWLVLITFVTLLFVTFGPVTLLRYALRSGCWVGWRLRCVDLRYVTFTVVTVVVGYTRFTLRLRCWIYRLRYVYDSPAFTLRYVVACCYVVDCCCCPVDLIYWLICTLRCVCLIYIYVVCCCCCFARLLFVCYVAFGCCLLLLILRCVTLLRCCYVTVTVYIWRLRCRLHVTFTRLHLHTRLILRCPHWLRFTHVTRLDVVVDSRCRLRCGYVGPDLLWFTLDCTHVGVYVVVGRLRCSHVYVALRYVTFTFVTFTLRLFVTFTFTFTFTVYVRCTLLPTHLRAFIYVTVCYCYPFTRLLRLRLVVARSLRCRLYTVTVVPFTVDFTTHTRSPRLLLRSRSVYHGYAILRLRWFHLRLVTVTRLRSRCVWFTVVPVDLRLLFGWFGYGLPRGWLHLRLRSGYGYVCLRYTLRFPFTRSLVYTLLRLRFVTFTLHGYGCYTVTHVCGLVWFTVTVTHGLRLRLIYTFTHVWFTFRYVPVCWLPFVTFTHTVTPYGLRWLRVYHTFTVTTFGCYVTRLRLPVGYGWFRLRLHVYVYVGCWLRYVTFTCTHGWLPLPVVGYVHTPHRFGYTRSRLVTFDFVWLHTRLVIYTLPFTVAFTFTFGWLLRSRLHTVCYVYWLFIGYGCVVTLHVTVLVGWFTTFVTFTVGYTLVYVC